MASIPAAPSPGMFACLCFLLYNSVVISIQFKYLALSRKLFVLTCCASFDCLKICEEAQLSSAYLCKIISHPKHVFHHLARSMQEVSKPPWFSFMCQRKHVYSFYFQTSVNVYFISQTWILQKRKYLNTVYSWAIIMAHVLHIMSLIGFSLLLSYNHGSDLWWPSEWFRLSLYNKCQKYTPILLGTHSYFMWKRQHFKNW